MTDRETSSGATRRAERNNVIQRLRCWWGRRSSEEEYLNAATDLADLERRMRVLERASGGPVFVTFNH